MKWVKLSGNEIFLFRDKSVFSANAKLTIKKSFFQHTKISISHRTKANEQLQILSAKTYCELAVQQSIFEKTSVLRQLYSHPFAPIQSLFTAVLWAKPVSTRAAGKLCKITSGRALNRGSQGFAPCAFWFFLHNAKRINPSPFRELPRFFKPRFSSPQ